MACRSLFVRALAIVARVISLAPASRAEGSAFELVEIVAPSYNEEGLTIATGEIAYVFPLGTFRYSWTPLPQRFGAEGFKTTLTVSGRLDGGPGQTYASRNVHLSLWGEAATTPSPGWAEVEVRPGENRTVSQDVTVRPEGELTDGRIVEIRVGTDLGPTFLYRYRVGSGSLPGDGGQIAAEFVNCPANITISELPSLTCHLKISGFRHDTADPVEVILPSAMGMQGNHSNGLQLPQSAGSLSVYNMADPHLWPLTLFACPGQPGAAVNCEGTAAAPGPLSVPIVVRQANTGETQVVLTINAVAGPNSVVEGKAGGGETVTTTPIPAGPGQIGAAVECPGAIVISALPSLNCHIVITGWRKDTNAPVRVSLPSSLTSPGNHPNGIQIYGQGEQDLSQWANEDSYRWGIFVFACPGQSSSGVNCEGRVTTPGPKVVLIEVEQEGLESAMLAFQITALPPQ